jgi:hypothetical protein
VAKIEAPAQPRLVVGENVVDQAKAVPAPRPGCENFGTFVDFVRSPQVAYKEAKEERKLVFLLHVSGNFEDDALT